MALKKHVISSAMILLSLIGGYFLFNNQSMIHSFSVSTGCYQNASDIWYCEYKGRIKGLYVNEDGLFRVSLSEPLPEPPVNSIPLEKRSEMVLLINDEPANKELRDQIRLAFNQSRSVKMHAHKVHKGYGVIGYVWVN